MKKKILKLLVVVVLFLSLVSITFAAAGITNVQEDSPFYRVGSNVFLRDSSWEIGDTTTRIAKGWFTDIDVTDITIGGVSSGDLDMGTHDITNIGSSVFGSATADTGTLTMIKGAQTSDPQVELALSADANGDFSITTDTGDITLTAADDIFLSVDGNIELALNGTDLYPQTSDGLALGNGTNMFSDLFLASGGVINFNNGNQTITHSDGTLTTNGDLAIAGALSGVTTLGMSGDLTNSAGNIVFTNHDGTISATTAAGVGNNLTFTAADAVGGGGGDFITSLTYLTISAVDYNDGMYFTPGSLSAIQEVTVADQVLIGGLLGTDNFDWATAAVTGGVHDGENITIIFTTIGFMNSGDLETYITAQLSATSTSVTNFFRVPNISANGATSNYTWALPVGGTYAAGSDPGASGYLDYSGAVVDYDGGSLTFNIGAPVGAGDVGEFEIIQANAGGDEGVAIVAIYNKTVVTDDRLMDFRIQDGDDNTWGKWEVNASDDTADHQFGSMFFSMMIDGDDKASVLEIEAEDDGGTLDFRYALAGGATVNLAPNQGEDANAVGIFFIYGADGGDSTVGVGYKGQPLEISGGWGSDAFDGVSAGGAGANLYAYGGGAGAGTGGGADGAEGNLILAYSADEGAAIGQVVIGSATASTDADLTLGNTGFMSFKEITTPTATATYGAIYTKDTNRLYFQDGGGIEHILAQTDTNYGEFKVSDNAVETIIRGDDEYQALTANVVTGLENGFTFDAGLIGETASIANDAGGILVTDVDHGLSAGDIITMNAHTNAVYNGIFEVLTVPSTSTFTVNATYTATGTGYWQKGASLTVGSGAAGTYAGNWNSTGIAAANGQTVDFCPVVNTTYAAAACARRTFSNADYGSFGGTEIVTLAVDDIIWFVMRNTTSDGNVTIRTLDLNLHRL